MRIVAFVAISSVHATNYSTAITDDRTVWQTMETTSTTTSQPEQAQPTDMVTVNTVTRRKTSIARHDGSDQQRVFLNA